MAAVSTVRIDDTIDHVSVERCGRDAADYSARTSLPRKGLPSSGAKTQTSNAPASKGTTPTTATMTPIAPPSPQIPHVINAMPATTRTTRPLTEAMKLTNGFISNLLSINGCFWIVTRIGVQLTVVVYSVRIDDDRSSIPNRTDTGNT